MLSRSGGLYLEKRSKTVRNLKFVLRVFLIASLSVISACGPKVGSQLFLAEAGASQFGPQQKYVVFEVPSAGSRDDEEFYRNSRLYGSSDLVQRLSRIMARSEKMQVKIVVGGPSSEKTRHVVLNALRRNKGRTLGGLMIVFVGSPDDAAVVQRAAYPMLATVYFAAG